MMRHSSWNSHSNILWRLFNILLVTIALVIICYYFVDRSVSNYVASHTLNRFKFFLWMTYISPMIIYLSFILFLIMIWKMLTTPKITIVQKTSFYLTSALIIVLFLKNQLKIIFGRYWPETWILNNSSWIKDRAYGFNFFQGGVLLGSFPSGHATVVFFTTTVLWRLFPTARWFYVICCIFVSVGLVAMNFHFVSDIIAAAGFGIMSGIITNYILNSRVKN